MPEKRQLRSLQRSLLRFGLLTTLLVALLAPRAINAEEPVQLLTGLGYVRSLLADLAAAQQSVDIMLFACVLPVDARPGHPVQQLLEAVIAAHRRGVVVRVILDQETFADGTRDTVNDLAVATLAAGGVAVRRDEPDRRTHTKTVVVDGTVVITGSTNWTWSAFHRNREHGIRLRHRGLAAAITSDFAEAWQASTVLDLTAE